MAQERQQAVLQQSRIYYRSTTDSFYSIVRFSGGMFMLMDMSSFEQVGNNFSEDEIQNYVNDWGLTRVSDTNLTLNVPVIEDRPDHVMVELNENHSARVDANGVHIDGHTYEFALFDQIADAVRQQQEAPTL